jgi:aspartyl-tRNA(Asn)/glutamyl-tRNA(Gln) amidotransferase subunit C
MAISREQVRHVASLARLALTAEEEAAFTEQLGHILTHFEHLNDLDTKDVEPTAHIVPMATPYREDAVRNRPAPDDWLANAPSRDDRFFKVPKIIE